MMQILEQLKAARERKGLDCDALAERTRLRVQFLEALEEGRFDALPRGVYARAVVRAYADAVGLDPNPIVTEVSAMLPEAEDPLDGMARVRGLVRPARRESPAPRPEPAAAEATDPVIQAEARPLVRIEPRQMTWQAPMWDSDLARAAGVSVVDGSILSAIALLLIGFTARVSGVPAAVLLEGAGAAILMLVLVIAALYFLLLGGVRGQTVGARLFAMEHPEPTSRVTAATATRRAWMMALRESSIVVDALLAPVGRGHADGTPAVARSRMQ